MSGFANYDEAHKWARHTVVVVDASPTTLVGFGEIVKDFDSATCNVQPWPGPSAKDIAAQPNLVPLSVGTGLSPVQEGLFTVWWEGMHDPTCLYPQARGSNLLFEDHHYTSAAMVAQNEAVVAEMNYHACSDQVFFPTNASKGKPFLLPLALPNNGEHTTPSKVVVFRFTGNEGIRIFHGVFHNPPFPAYFSDTIKFHNKQAIVHTCFNTNFVQRYKTAPAFAMPEGTTGYGTMV
jgi:ureidoglycolate hydrolase